MGDSWFQVIQDWSTDDLKISTNIIRINQSKFKIYKKVEISSVF